MSSPSIVPRGDDETVYFVTDDLGELGQVWRETDIEATDLETVIGDVLSGQYSRPVRVVAFNTAEQWSRDVAEVIAREVRRRSDMQDVELAEGVEAFEYRHEGEDRRQLTLRLA